MARLTYRFPSLDSISKVAYEGIPGLKFDRSSPVLAGYIDALEAVGIDVKKEWPDLFTFNHGPIEHAAIRPYQLEGVNWILNTLTTHRAAILADDMGLGKTRTAIYTITQLPYVRSCLIVAPANVLYQWQEEAAQFGLKTHVLGPKSNKKFASAWELLEAGGHHIFITSYQMSVKALDIWPFVPDMFIFDEPHMFFRGRSNKIAWALKEYTQQSKYRLACTGTPMFNKPADMWFLLFILFTNRFGKAKEFDARYCDGKQGTYGWTNSGASNLPELKQRLTHYMLRRTTEDVKLQLPPLTTSFRWVEASATAKAAMMKVTSGGPAIDEALRACLDEKVSTAVEVALEMQPCVVFTYYRHHAEKIAAEIEAGGGKAIALHGGISAQERHGAVKLCASQGASIVATIDSMGTGTNLQGVSSNMVFHTIERSPKKTHQAIKRTHRSGQDKPGKAVFIAMRDAMDEIVSEQVVKRLGHWEELMGRDTMNNDLEPALKTDDATEDEILRSIYEAMK